MTAPKVEGQEGEVKAGTALNEAGRQPTTQLSETPSPAEKAAAEDSKKILVRAQQLDKETDHSKSKHFGVAGTGAKEVGKDTGISPGKNVGLQNVSAEAHKKATEELNEAKDTSKNSHRRKVLTMEELQTMSPAEIRAIASDRGYMIRPGGWRSTSRQFLDQQKEDEGLDKVVKK